MALQTSAELQEVVLASLIKDSYLLSSVKSQITEQYFTGANFRLIYKALKIYHDRYSSLPDLRSLIVTIQELYNETFGTLNEIQEKAVSLFNAQQMDDNFVMDRLTTFVKRNKVENALKNIMPLLKDGKDFGIEKAADALLESLTVNFTKSTVFTLGNLDQLSEIRASAIGDEDKPMIIRSCLEPVNQALQFKGFKPGDLVMVVAAPGVGKTSYLTNEGANAARQGYNVLNIYLGDMTEYDGFVRYTSCLSGIPQDEIALMSVEDQKQVVMQANMASNGAFGRISLLSYAAHELTIDQMIENVYKAQDRFNTHFDMIIVDYADNLIRESSMMYESGGIMYNKLSLLMRTNRSVGLVASQPKVSYWNKEIIPKEGAAESSQKQHVIDLMLTFGKPSADANIGTIFMPKVRRGQAGKLVRVETQWERCYLRSISEPDYIKAKAQYV
ncbi:replicative helicase [Bacillus phage SP-15]|uniref:Replicative helicase n=1 Tax=Bacillus phage SP-15 TaxID=1792032 RepID=A0A127AW66_9CAUD|nr:replicative helicase [Bacillus phage SP-15]AMM44888.1 replicative helicase [Bacillus phage SP-15]